MTELKITTVRGKKYVNVTNNDNKTFRLWPEYITFLERNKDHIKIRYNGFERYLCLKNDGIAPLVIVGMPKGLPATLDELINAIADLKG